MALARADDGIGTRRARRQARGVRCGSRALKGQLHSAVGGAVSGRRIAHCVIVVVVDYQRHSLLASLACAGPSFLCGLRQTAKALASHGVVSRTFSVSDCAKVEPWATTFKVHAVAVAPLAAFVSADFAAWIRLGLIAWARAILGAFAHHRYR